MAQPVTITTVPLPPAKDFNLLRREGMSEIARLAEDTWTDHNTHDPGITMLEQFCFLLTDLGYKLSFPMKDLLAPAQDDPQKDIKQFFTASEVLLTNPLTAEDYRRLLLDVDGVRNARIEPIKNSAPGIYWDENARNLTFSSTLKTERVALKGLYRVLLEIKTGALEKEVKAKVKTILNSKRNLCEDFVEILVLPEETIDLKADIELEEGGEIDPDKIMAKMYFELERFLSPEIEFSSLKEILIKGSGVENIYSGPKLPKGFLEDDQLINLERKNELRVSDLMHIILDIPGVKAVQKLQITSNVDDWKSWALTLSSGRTPSLKSLNAFIASGNIYFFKRGIELTLNSSTVETEYNHLKTAVNRSPSSFEDIPVPKGKYRDLKKYSSVQYEFPAAYGIGNVGLPNSVHEKRKAQAKQLQAYLMIFDQILTNYNQQLAHTKDIFAVGNNLPDTYFSQKISDSDTIPGHDYLLADTYAGELQNIMGDHKQERQNRLLDHLLARFGEDFTDHYLLNHSDVNKTIDRKKYFLRNYPKIGEERNKGFDYSVSETADTVLATNNVSGLKRRICGLLGIEQVDRVELKTGNVEGFHLVEHILLRPEEVSGSPIDTGDENIKDPYSMRVSFVFPDQPGRFGNEAFKRLAVDVIRLETPAHIAFRILWLDNTTMGEFEGTYHVWLEKKADSTVTVDRVQAAADALFEKLKS